jgi:hypothetical protein
MTAKRATPPNMPLLMVLYRGQPCPTLPRTTPATRPPKTLPQVSMAKILVRKPASTVLPPFLCVRHLSHPDPV